MVIRVEIFNTKPVYKHLDVHKSYEDLKWGAVQENLKAITEEIYWEIVSCNVNINFLAVYYYSQIRYLHVERRPLSILWEVFWYYKPVSAVQLGSADEDD